MDGNLGHGQGNLRRAAGPVVAASPTRLPGSPAFASAQKERPVRGQDVGQGFGRSVNLARTGFAPCFRPHRVRVRAGRSSDTGTRAVLEPGGPQADLLAAGKASIGQHSRRSSDCALDLQPNGRGDERRPLKLESRPTCLRARREHGSEWRTDQPRSAARTWSMTCATPTRHRPGPG